MFLGRCFSAESGVAMGKAAEAGDDIPMLQRVVHDLLIVCQFEMLGEQRYAEFLVRGILGMFEG